MSHDKLAGGLSTEQQARVRMAEGNIAECDALLAGMRTEGWRAEQVKMLVELQHGLLKARALARLLRDNQVNVGGQDVEGQG